jgi:hypothetical protein
MQHPPTPETAAETTPSEPEAVERPAGHGWAGWVISGSLHVALLLLFGTVVYAINQQQEPVVTRLSTVQTPVVTPPPPPPRFDPQPQPQYENPHVADVDAPATSVVITENEMSDDEENDAQVPRGRDNALTQVAEMGGQGMNMAIGLSAGAMGKFGDLRGGGRSRRLKDGGGGPRHERAVGGALRWLKRHQSPDGRWDADGYQVNCDGATRCEPGRDQAGDTDAALTGYALLCYLGHGHAHTTPGYFQATVAKAVRWLVANQQPDGMIGQRNYEHAVATMALAEAYAMSDDPDLRAPAQRAVDALLRRQNRDAKATDPHYARLGWDYIGPSDRNDASVTGWACMALKSALIAKLDVGEGMQGARQWLERAWRAANPDHARLGTGDVSRFPYTWSAVDGRIEIGTPGSDSKDLASVGLVASIFLGHADDGRMRDSLAAYVMRHQMPTTWPLNTYYMYYNTLGIFQMQGESWRRWNDTVLELLLTNQRDDGCFAGSWDWAGQRWHGADTGRVLSTVYCTLSLEVFYRYELLRPSRSGSRIKGAL